MRVLREWAVKFQAYRWKVAEMRASPRNGHSVPLYWLWQFRNGGKRPSMVKHLRQVGIGPLPSLFLSQTLAGNWSVTCR